MADDRDSDLGDDSPVSARSEGESSEHSCESSDEGVGRGGQPLRLSMQLQQGLLRHPMHPHQHTAQPSMTHEQIKVRDDFESLKSIHPHLSSLASLAQGAPLSAPNGVYALAGAGAPSGFPYTPPAFLAPAPPPPAPPAGSASSSSSEGSAAGWSFEEQYKQVRQLYEISDDPQRKEFLDDLFSFMQRRGTPINRLPIMAKSVLDLYELYNLVIARGGLVEVINKKLWQEIIKGLRLPSSITSAAFTLRTQYMKYLYEYECDKKKLSTRSELDAAIEGNKREGRRPSGQFDAQAALSSMANMPQLNRGMPLGALGLGMGLGVPRLPMVPGVGPGLGPGAGPGAMPGPGQLVPPELEYRVREYLKMLQQEQVRQMARNGSESPPSSSNGPSTSPREHGAPGGHGVPGGHGGHGGHGMGGPLSALDVSRLTLWSMYGTNNNTTTNNHNAPEPEPQNEALNLSDISPRGVKRAGEPLSPAGKRHASPLAPTPPASSRTTSTCSPAPPAASPAPPPSPRAASPPSPRASPPAAPAAPPAANGHGLGGLGTMFKICTQVSDDGSLQQLLVSAEVNGVTYVGVLTPAARPAPAPRAHHSLVS